MKKSAIFRMGILLALLGAVTFLGWGGYRWYVNVQFNRHCMGYLKRAADANTVTLAKQELDRALAYVEQNNLTSGYTTIIFRYPDEDVSFWYQNLKASNTELSKVRSDATPSEVSIVLVKLRETLLDQSGNKLEVTVPSGISVFPHNVLVSAIGWLSFLLFVLGCWMSRERGW